MNTRLPANARRIWTTLALLAILACCSPAVGQLDRDLRDVFEGMLEDLEPDLRSKFESAIAENRSSIEFTPAEFKRFQNHPANPFDGVHEIDPDSLDGNIELKFELPSIRNRTISRYEKQHQQMLDNLRPLTRSVAASVVVIQDGFGSRQPRVVYGTVVGAEGLILTKASEIETLDRIVCVLNSGKQYLARRLRTDGRNDLALLQIEASNLTPIRFSSAQPLPGGFLLTPDERGQAITLGIYSSVPRSTTFGKQAFLGVQPREHESGVVISEITRDSAAGRAGLKNGDIITRFNNTRITNVTELVNFIRTNQPGDEVAIEYLREGRKSTTRATFSGRNVSSERAAQFKMMNRLGAVPSRRATGFPSVFQHDSPLFPEDCGGPILDLEGNVLGLNIARGGRASTYSIPANHLKQVLDELLHPEIASRDK